MLDYDGNEMHGDEDEFDSDYREMLEDRYLLDEDSEDYDLRALHDLELDMYDVENDDNIEEF